MDKIDINRLLTLAALIAIVVIAALSNYRLEIAALGLKFERNDIYSDALKDEPKLSGDRRHAIPRE